MSHNATAGSRIQTISPVDGSVYLERQVASGPEIEAKLATAKRVQKEWRLVPVKERAAICRRMVSFLVERAEQLGTELTWQMGRPIRYSPMEIRRGFQERALYMIDIAEEELADIALQPKTTSDVSSAVTQWVWFWRSCRGITLTYVPSM